MCLFSIETVYVTLEKFENISKVNRLKVNLVLIVEIFGLQFNLSKHTI